jgi:hypothetical protein
VLLVVVSLGWEIGTQEQLILKEMLFITRVVHITLQQVTQIKSLLTLRIGIYLLLVQLDLRE